MHSLTPKLWDRANWVDVITDVSLEYQFPNRHGPWSLQVSYKTSWDPPKDPVADIENRSRYHVPVQSVNVVLFYIGRYFGHHHGGRQFPSSVHGVMASIVTWIVFIVSPSP